MGEIGAKLDYDDNGYIEESLKPEREEVGPEVFQRVGDRSIHIR